MEAIISSLNIPAHALVQSPGDLCVVRHHVSPIRRSRSYCVFGLNEAAYPEAIRTSA